MKYYLDLCNHVCKIGFITNALLTNMESPVGVFCTGSLGDTNIEAILKNPACSLLLFRVAFERSATDKVHKIPVMANQAVLDGCTSHVCRQEVAFCNRFF